MNSLPQDMSEAVKQTYMSIMNADKLLKAVCDEFSVCPECNGQGYREERAFGRVYQVDCAACKGQLVTTDQEHYSNDQDTSEIQAWEEM